MNINKELIIRVTERFAENKNPCKAYKTEEACDKAMEKTAQMVADYFSANRNVTAKPCQYVVVFVPAMGKWVGGLNYTELLARSTSTGGYIGVAKDVYTF